jgi:hypothetical protein
MGVGRFDSLAKLKNLNSIRIVGHPTQYVIPTILCDSWVSAVLNNRKSVQNIDLYCLAYITANTLYELKSIAEKYSERKFSFSFSFVSKILSDEDYSSFVWDMETSSPVITYVCKNCPSNLKIVYRLSKYSK